MTSIDPIFFARVVACGPTDTFSCASFVVREMFCHWLQDRHEKEL